MLIISGANHRIFKLLKRVADYYADNQPQIGTSLVNQLSLIKSRIYRIYKLE